MVLNFGTYVKRLANLGLDLLFTDNLFLTYSRIVIVSSMAHERASMNWEDLNWEKNYDTFKAYCQSKLANILHAKELSSRLEGTGITVYVLHPGNYFKRHLMNRGLSMFFKVQL